MRREESQLPGHVAQRQRQARVGGAAERRADAGHDHRRHAGLAEIFELLAATAEDERVTALEPHHPSARARRLGQAAVDLMLTDAGRAAPFADKYAFGVT